jgi:hypothetical protein
MREDVTKGAQENVQDEKCPTGSKDSKGLESSESPKGSKGAKDKK